MRFLFFIWFNLIAINLWAQDIKSLTPEQLHADLEGLKEGLETYNPAMYAYHPKVEFEQRIEVLKATITTSIDAVQWYKILCFATTGAYEGHITIGTTEDEFFKGFLKGDFKSLPLSLQCLGERAYIWHNLSRNDVLERGDELLSINGQSIASIRQQIFQHTVSDAGIETFKQKRYSKEFAARYFWFIERPDRFQITYKKHGEEQIRTVVLEALTRSEMSQWSIKRQYKSSRFLGIDKVYSLSINKDIAQLTLRSFDEAIIKENDIKAYAFYESIFQRLRRNKVKHLIIDVRNNIGGLKAFGDDMLPFLLKKNRKGVFRELESWNGELSQASFPKRSRWWFKGQLYILVDGGTYSTAAHIAKYAKEFADAITIGEEAGSRYEGFAAGTYHQVTLPYSQTKIAIPNKWVKNIISEKQPTKNRGLLPDYEVQPTIDDLLNNKDVAREKALELIREN